MYKGEQVNVDYLDLSLLDVNDDFSFIDYVDYFINLSHQKHNLYVFFETPSKSPERTKYEKEIQGLHAEFTERVKAYERFFFETGIDPSLKIIELANLYKRAISILIDLDKKNKVMADLATVIKRVSYLKEKEEEEKAKEEEEKINARKQRIEAYRNGELPFYKLHYGDIKKMYTSEEAINAVRATKARLHYIDDKMYNDYTLEALYYHILEMEKTK